MRRNGRPTVLALMENVPLAHDHRLLKQTSTLVAEGYEVHVVCRRHLDNQSVPGVVVHEYPPPRDAGSRWGYVREYGAAFLWTAWLTARVAARTRFDVVQLCGAPDIWFPIARVLRRRGSRIVYDQRDPSPELYEARYGVSDSAMRRVLLRLERATHHVADHVLAVNRSLADLAVARGGHDIGAVSVVGNGPVLASLEDCQPRPELRQGRRFLCVWHGMMGPQDRVDLVVRAVAHYVLELGRTDCTFLIHGDGESLREVQALTAELQLQDYITITGWIPRAEVFRCVASADLGVESTLDPFVSPVKIMEYMGFGLPVAAFDVLETHRLAEDAAVYATAGDPADLARQIARVLDDEPTRDRLSSAGRRRVRTAVAWDFQARVYVDVFRRLREQVPASAAEPGADDAESGAGGTQPFPPLGAESGQHLGRSVVA